MTYFGFLLRFLVLPILALLAAAVLDSRAGRKPEGFADGRAVWIAILVHIALAVAYTTPWDNYLVATGVWYYNPELVSGVLIGFVPIEEYTFFVLETILAGLWWWFLARRLPSPGSFQGSKPARVTAALSLGIAWIVSSGLFLAGDESLTYLSITLAWAFPAILPQLLFGADILWHHRRLVAAALLVPGTYLSLTDIVALHETTWSIAADQTTGILFFGILPLEEVTFFFITNILVTFGMTLLLSEHGRRRFADWRAAGFKRLP